jgi:integrase
MVTTKTVKSVPIGQFRDEVYNPATADGSLNDTNLIRVTLRRMEKLGAVTTADLTPEMLDRFASAIDGETLRPSTVRSYLFGLRKACAAAVERGFLAVSPFDNRPELVERSQPARHSVDGPRQRLYSPTQFKAVLDGMGVRASESFVNHRAFAVAAVIAYTGLRHTDAARLRVEDIDFENELIRVPHRARRGRTPGAIPMPAELSQILREWLRQRGELARRLHKFDDVTAEEIRKLAGEGQSHGELAERYGIRSVSTVSRVVRGLTWSSSKLGGPGKLAAGSEWVFPQIGRGFTSTRPWIAAAPNHGWKVLKDVAEAVGAKGLTLGDLRYIHKRYVVPAVITLNPDQAAPRAEVSPIILGSLTTPPVVGGVEIREPPLTEDEYDCLAVLKKYEPTYVLLPRLIEKSGKARPDRILQKLTTKHGLWARWLDVFPGKREGGEPGYGIRRP